jgi:hypothetical protein
MTMPLRCLLRASSLPNHVPEILAGSPNPQMVRVHAGPIVTSMTDVHAFGDQPVRQFIGIPMRSEGLALDGELTVAADEATTGPCPARIRATRPVNLLPEPLFCRSLRRIAARHRAEPVGVPTPTNKRLAAGFTSILRVHRVLLTLGVTPGAVSAALRPFYALSLYHPERA